MKNFKNDVLEMNILSDKKFECIFLGDKSTHSTSADYMPEYFEDIKNKRLSAYDLVPSGCKIVPKSLAPLLDGLLIGGVLEDSIYIVYGLGEGCSGIRGYSCSLLFFPAQEVLDSMMNYDSLHGEFIVKK